MAITRGCFGKAKSGATPDSVVQLRAWNFEETGEEIDTSVMGTCTKSFEAGAVETSGSITAFWDTTDAGQINFVVGSIIALELYPGGDASGAKYYEGNALVTSISRTGAIDGVVEQAMNFKVNGGMTLSTVA